MAITKTNFINFSRCPRYVSLHDVKKNRLDSNISIEDYREEEKDDYIKELLDNMYEIDENSNEIDLIDKKDEQLEVMMPFYNKIELLAGKIAKKYFDGKFIYAWDTKNQESFDVVINGIRYLCYVDIYNELKDRFNIIEVKATSTKKFLSLGVSKKNDFGDKEIISIFQKNEKGIYCLLEDLNLNIEDYMPTDKYNKQKSKLLDRYSPVGHYVFDLAVQRYIIENDLKNNSKEKIDKVKYYLAVLNSDYTFSGKYENNEPIYDTDESGNEIVAYFDLTSVTKDWMEQIDLIRKRVENYVIEMEGSEYPIGHWCEHKKTYGCKFFKVCSHYLPEKNSVLNYIENHFGFKDIEGNKYDRFDLIRDGMHSMLDVPENYLNREKNRIQRNCVLKDEIYYNIDKIKAGINVIQYPIYHLDFETLPCPLPRYRGEKCYSQSVFQFSLHIEKEEGICDKEADHYGYLAKNHDDIREELIQKMIEWIDTSKGTILVYNESFEKTRFKELAHIFPKYKKELLKMKDMIYDLMNVVKTKSSLYEELGFNEDEAKMFNFYHKDMNGSFSIKKILPLFTDLSYSDLEVSNGTEALVTYAKFPSLEKREYDYLYESLIKYCQQDTWAMVEILKGLRKLVNEKNR